MTNLRRTVPFPFLKPLALTSENIFSGVIRVEFFQGLHEFFNVTWNVELFSKFRKHFKTFSGGQIAAQRTTLSGYLDKSLPCALWNHAGYDQYFSKIITVNLSHERNEKHSKKKVILFPLWWNIAGGVVDMGIFPRPRNRIDCHNQKIFSRRCCLLVCYNCLVR